MALESLQQIAEPLPLAIVEHQQHALAVVLHHKSIGVESGVAGRGPNAIGQLAHSLRTRGIHADHHDRVPVRHAAASLSPEVDASLSAGSRGHNRRIRRRPPKIGVDVAARVAS
jgi:hypothetical protein